MRLEGFGPRAARVSQGRRAKRSVNRLKNPSTWTSQRKFAFGRRSVACHQSTTVVPRVNGLVVSTLTLTILPLNSSG